MALTVIAILATCGAIATLRSLRPAPLAPPTTAADSNPGSGTAAKPANAPDTADAIPGDDNESSVPQFDTSIMQPEVGDRLSGARANLLKNKGSATAWGDLAVACDAHGLHECAETCYRRAHSLDPDDFRYIYLLAVLLDRKGGHPDEFIEMYRNAARLEPDYPQAHYRIGEALVEQGNVSQAGDYFRLVTDLDPDFAPAHRSLGQVALALGDPQAAIQNLQRALELAPDDGVTYATLANAYTALGDSERGRDAAEKARSLEHPYDIPDPLRDEVHAMAISSPACYDRAKQLIHEGRHAEAIPDLKIVVKARPKDHYVQVFLGSAYHNTGQLDLAERHLSKALRLAPDSVSALMEMCRVMSEMGRPEDAIRYGRRARELKPNHPRINVELAYLLVNNGSFQEAIGAYERAAAAETLGPEEEMLWGFALRHTGSIDEGVRHLREAVRLAPEYALAHYHLADALQARGDTDEGAEHYRRAAEINPELAAPRQP